MINDYEDREVISGLLIGLCAAAFSGMIVGCVLGACLLWLAAGVN